MLGNPGDGWRVSLTTLMNERVSIGGVIPQRGSGVIAELVGVWTQLPAEQRDAARRDEVTQLVDPRRGAAPDEHPRRVNRKLGDPGPEGSIGKAAAAALNKDVLAFAVTLLGPAGMLYGDYSMKRPRFSSDTDSAAEGVPAQPGELDRGRDVRGDVQHPRRTRPRPARRRARRSRRAVEPGAAQLTSRFAMSADSRTEQLADLGDRLDLVLSAASVGDAG